MINNRQNGRRRGRGGGGGGNGGPRQGGQGRDNGNRIDSRARGNANQLLEKYKNLAADAQRQGDRVNTEYYLQFADHYFRVLADQRGRFEDQQPRRQPRDEFDLDGDEDFGDEGEPIRSGEQQGEARVARDDRQQAPRGNRDERRDEQRGNRWQPREERGERTLSVAAGDDEPEVGGQHRSDPPMPGESLDQRAEAVLDADAPAPRRRGRPRREEPAAGVDADRLPPSLGIAPANDEDEAPKPRRRRSPRGPAAEVPSAAE